MEDMIHTTVQPGDGFFSIAARLAPGISTGKKLKFAEAIATANDMTFKSTLYPGQILHIIPSTIPTV